MKTDALIKLLGDLNHLNDVEELDLNNLIQTYPYVQNFRFLLAKKKTIE